MDRRLLAAPAAILIVACHRDAIEVRRDPAPPSPSPSVSPPPEPPKPKTRVHGDIDGRFTIANANVFAGEPIVVELEFQPLSADLTVFFGGDMRNQANYPMRFAVRATDAGGKEVCDLVAKPALMSFGGPGSDRVIAKGELYRERFVLNPACPALATPGSYRVTVHRRLTRMSMTIKKPGSPTPMSCDVTPIHEDPLPAWIDPACAKMLTDAPSVTTELAIVVKPFDQKEVRAAIAARLHEAPKDETLRHRVQAFVCRFVTCSCPALPAAESDLLAAIGATPQPTFPASCP
jgi:hypothetical protein